MPTAKRDFIGYGPQPPDPRWPGNARLALNFVVKRPFRKGLISNSAEGSSNMRGYETLSNYM